MAAKLLPEQEDVEVQRTLKGGGNKSVLPIIIEDKVEVFLIARILNHGMGSKA